MRALIFAVCLLLLTPLAMAHDDIAVYGLLDTGIVKETGSNAVMKQNNDNRIGVRAKHDLGSGYQTLFQIEKRFFLNDGTRRGVEFDGITFLGLNTPVGQFRLGRLNELPTETFRRLDPFNQNGVGRMLFSSQRSVRISNTLRYDAPEIKGFKLGTHVTLSNSKNNDLAQNLTPQDKAHTKNTGYAFSATYSHGSLYLVGNYSRVVNSNDSNLYNLGIRYQLGKYQFSIGYEKTQDKGFRDSLSTPLKRSDQNNWLTGLSYSFGASSIHALLAYMNVDRYQKDLSDGHIKRCSLGYTHKLSKRTTLYAIGAYTDFENQSISTFFQGQNATHPTHLYSWQFGIEHRF